MSNNNLWNRLFGTSKKRRTTNPLDRFSEQFDTRLNFRELEPRMVLSGTAMDTDGDLGDSNLSLEISLEDGEMATVTAEKMGSKAKVIVDIDGVKTNFTGITNLESIKLVGANDAMGTTFVELDSSLNIAELEGDGLTLDFLTIDGIDSTKIEAKLSTPTFSITNPLSNTDDLSVTQDPASSIAGANLTITNASAQSINVSLNSTLNDLNSVASSGSSNTITISDKNSVVLGDINATALNVTTDADNSGNDGGITQSASTSVVVSGTTTLVAGVGDDVALDETANDFNIISVLGGSPAGTVSISDANDIDLGAIDATTLMVVTDADQTDDDGAITQNGVSTIKVSGTSVFTSGNGEAVTLTNANEFTGAVSVAGQSAAAGTVMISNDMALITGNINAGDLTLTAKGDISQASSTVADATSATFVFDSAAATLDFDNTGNTFGSVVITNPTNLNNFLLNNDDATAVIPAGMLPRLSSGLMTDVSLIFTGTGDLALPAIDILGDLTVQTNGNITQSAAIQVDGTASFISGGVTKSITLNDAGNDFNVVSAIGGSPAMAVNISDTGDVVLGKIDATTLTVIADSDNSGTDGTITQKGATTISATMTANFTSGNGKAVTLTNANEFQGTVSVMGQLASASGKVEISDISAIDLTDINADSLIVLANTDATGSDGAITDAVSSTIAVANTAKFDGDSITLGDNAGDSTNFGMLNFISGGNVTIQEDSDTELTGTNTAKNLAIDSGGDITQAALSTVTVTNEADFISGGPTKSITLANTDNDFNIISAIGGSPAMVVDISDKGDVVLGTINATTLTITADSDKSGGDGMITQVSGKNIEASGTSIFTSGKGEVVTLTEANDFKGTVSVFGQSGSASGKVEISDISAIDLADINADSLIVLANTDATGSDGAITDASGSTIAVANAAMFSGDSITLGDNAGDSTNFGTLNFTAGAGDTVAIQEDSTTNLEGTNTAGNLVLESAGSIIENAAATIELTQPLFGSTTTGDAKFIVGADDAMAMNGNLVIDLFEDNIIRAAEFSAQDGTDTIKTLKFRNVYNDDDLAGNNENKFTEASSPVLPPAILETLDIEYTHAPLTIESVTVGNILTDGSIRIVSGDGVLTKSADNTVVEDTFINDITNAVITGTPVGKTVTGEFESDRWIQLANAAGDAININGDVSFKSNLGYLIEVGTTITADPTTPTPMIASRGTDSGATVNFGAVNFNAQSAGLLGHVTIVEDSDMEVYGSNTADSLFLHTPLHNISDRNNTQIDVDGLAVFIADNNITLANHKNDVLDVTGNATFYASGILDAIDVGVTPQANPLDAARGVDSGASVSLSSVHFTAANVGADNADPTLDIGKVTIFDDTDSVLDHANSLKFNLLTFNNFFMRSLVFNSGGSLTDATDTDIITFGTHAFTHFSTDTTIALADNSADFISTLGNAFFESRTGLAIDVGVAPTTQLAAARGKDSGALVFFGNLTFSSQDGTNGDVTIKEDSSTQIAHTHLDDSNKADSLVLVSSGDITDAAKVAPNTATSINVTNFAEFNAATNIVLADNADDKLTVGGNALFSSASSEFFSAPVVDHRINVGVTDLDTTTMPTNATRGTDSKATVLLGSVTFSGREPDGMGKTDTHVTIREDHDMELANSTRSGHKNIAETGFLVTSGTLTDADGTDVTLEDFGVMIAGSSITLANNKNDSISIANNATFGTFTGAAVDIGVTPAAQMAAARGANSKASVNFGSLHYTSNANSADVTIFEDSNTQFDRGAFMSFETLDLTTYFADSSSVTSAGTILDSTGTVFNNSAFAEFIAHGAAGSNQSITLADTATDKMSIAGNALFESTAGGDIEVGVLPTATAGAFIDIAATRGKDSGATVNFGSLTTNSPAATSNVTVREDGDMVLSNSQRLGQDIDAGSLFFVASDSGDLIFPSISGTATISDATGTSINSVDLAVFRTDDSITLADNKGDSLTVGANATFYTTDLVSINVGVTPQADPLNVNRGADSDAQVTFGSVHFSAENLLPALNTGGVTIYEDNDSLFDNTNQVLFDLINFGDQFARSIVFSSAGNITDAKSTSIRTDFGLNAADSFAHFSADNQITLADKSGDRISVLGNAFFESKTGQEIHVGVDPTKAVNALDRGADSGATVDFGTLAFRADGKDGHVTINEDSATVFADALHNTKQSANHQKTSVAESLTLHSDGSITDADLMTDLVVRDLAHFEARTGAVEFDIVLGNNLMNNQVDLSELFFIANDVSIVEQSNINSADDQAVYLYDGSTANGQIAIQTSGHLIQVNDARPGAVAGFGESISATTGLFHAEGAIVLTNIEFNTLAAHAENTVEVEAGKSLESTDAGVMGSLTSDLLPSFLPTSDSDTFAPPAPAPTDGSSAADAASDISLSEDYSMVIEHHGNLVIDKLDDIVGGKVLSVTGIKTDGSSAGHVFLETLENGSKGNLTFNVSGAASVDIANQKVFTGLAAGNLVINPLTELLSHVNSKLSDPITSEFPGTQPFGPALTNTVGKDGVVTTISTYNDVDPAAASSEGPSYVVNANSDGVVQASGILAPLGYRVDITVDKVGETLEKNNRLEIVWDDGNSDVLLFEDGISAATLFNHFYNIAFPANHANQAFVTVNAYNDPLINLFDQVTSSASKDAAGLTGAEDLNFVTDTIRVVFKDPPPAPKLPPPFVKPLSPVYEYPAIPEQSSDAPAGLIEYADDPTILLQIQDVSAQKYNEVTMEYGEKEELSEKNLFTLEQVKAYIYEEPKFLPGEYRISILLAGQQEPLIDNYIKPDPSSFDTGFPESSSNHSLEYLKQLADSQEIERSTETAEQVWEQQYEQWFPTVEIEQIDDTSAVLDSKANAEGSDSTDQVSAYVAELLLDSAQVPQLVAINLDNDLRLGESWKSRNRTNLALGMGGAMIMGAYAMNNQAQNERKEAVEETLSSEKTKIKFSKRARLRERLKRIF